MNNDEILEITEEEEKEVEKNPTVLEILEHLRTKILHLIATDANSFVKPKRVIFDDIDEMHDQGKVTKIESIWLKIQTEKAIEDN